MPASFQGTVLRAHNPPILDLDLAPGHDRRSQQHMLDALHDYNTQHSPAGPIIPSCRRASPVMRWPTACSSTHPRRLTCHRKPNRRAALRHGEPQTEDFGRKCLLARRLVEQGVRFIQVYRGGGHNDDNWDAHGDLVKNHSYHAGRTDKPVAGLLKDLKQRGLLDGTLVIWGGEFGRQPTAEYAKGTGRDHNAYGFTMWMAGGGIKGGVSVGETDELGSSAVHRPLPRQAHSCDGAESTGCRSQPPQLFLRRPRSKTGRCRRGRADPIDYGLSGFTIFRRCVYYCPANRAIRGIPSFGQQRLLPKPKSKWLVARRNEKRIMTPATFKTIPAQDDLSQVERDLSFHPVANAAPKTLSPGQIEQFNRDGYLKGLPIFTRC